MVILKFVSCINDWVFIQALCDGIYNNDAFKNTTGDENNEKWTQLLLDLKFFDDLDEKEHVMELRRRFVYGAADWMAGNNNSLQNDKAVFGYTDNEWQYIWSTMLEDGAWAVPSIKDENNGNIIKENFAPEILIKFIAHDIRANIIVFDLVLDNIQFVSGNLLKMDNVVFDSPLLMYSTGSHFQSVLQTNYEYFVHLAKKLQDRNICQMCPRERQLDISHGSIMQISRGKEEDLVEDTMNLAVKESVQIFSSNTQFVPPMNLEKALEDQPDPSGLDIKVDIQTGKKHAKLVVKSDNSKEDKAYLRKKIDDES